MKTLAIPSLLIMSALLAADFYPQHSVAAQLMAQSVKSPPDITSIEHIRHSAKLINLGFSGTTL